MRYAILLLLSICCFGQTDGPATLPQRTLETRASFTVSPNYPKHVGTADSVAYALAGAIPGDVITVDPGNTWTIAATYSLPIGDCNGKYITLRSSAMAMLPEEGTRVTPAFVQFMPKIVISGQSTSLIGGGCFKLEGFEITRTSGTGIVYNLFRNLGHDIILAHDYIHGTANDETNRGIQLINSYNIGIVDSYFTDFKCMAAVGACGDSQAITGGASTLPDGNYVIRNNFLQAAGENILFGGGPATQVTCDITVQYNTFDKPRSWNPWDPSYAPAIGRDGLSHPWIVKNNFELKNGCRVLFEGNTLGPVWGGFTQVGATILLTPKNAGVNGCPACAVTDVTIRYNQASYASQALQIGCSPSDSGYWPADCGRYSAHDNVFSHMQPDHCFYCGSWLMTIGSGNPNGPVLHDVSIDHNTLVNDGWIGYNSVWNAPNGANGIASLQSPPVGSAVMQTGMALTNNVFELGNSGFYSTGGGVLHNCWSQTASPAVKFAECWPGGVMTGNQMNSTLVKYYGLLPFPDGNTGNLAAGANMILVNAAIANQH